MHMMHEANLYSYAAVPIHAATNEDCDDWSIRQQRSAMLHGGIGLYILLFEQADPVRSV